MKWGRKEEATLLVSPLGAKLLVGQKEFTLPVRYVPKYGGFISHERKGGIFTVLAWSSVRKTTDTVRFCGGTLFTS